MSIQVVGGYYAAYYTNAKHPKPPAFIIDKMLNSKRVVPTAIQEEVEMEAKVQHIEELDAKFRERGYDV